MAFDRPQIYLQCALYCALRPTDDVPTQLYGPQNFTKLETTPPTQESDDLISNIAGSVGEVLASVQKATKPGQISLECNTMSSDLRSLIMSADVTAFSQSSGTVTDAEIDTALGIWTKLPGEYIAASGFSLKTSGNVAVAADKYLVDRIAGYLKPLHADAVGTGMKATFSKSAAAGEVYSAGKTKSAYLYLTGKAYDKYTGTYGTLTVEKASVSNSQAYDWVAGGWMKGALSGPLLTPIGADSPIKFVATDFTG
ncbi:MAG: hypothetical protein P9E88_14840 [Candidatus Competibacter sp.]|nr:hypothetical protein [Candidatus Competibacter sp.]